MKTTINDGGKTMDEITIYKFQLETIIEALRLTSNYNHSSKGETCYDRQVRQAYEFAKNALSGKKDKEVKYMGGEYSDPSPKQGETIEQAIVDYYKDVIQALKGNKFMATIEPKSWAEQWLRDKQQINNK